MYVHYVYLVKGHSNIVDKNLKALALKLYSVENYILFWPAIFGKRLFIYNSGHKFIINFILW